MTESSFTYICVCVCVFIHNLLKIVYLCLTFIIVSQNNYNYYMYNNKNDFYTRTCISVCYSLMNKLL